MKNRQRFIAGNYFNKHESTNIVYKKLVSNYRKTLQGLISGISPQNCVEIGSGEGYILEYLHNALPIMKIFGSDIDFNLCKLGDSSHKFSSWVNMEGENIPLASASADLMVACEVLEHVQDPQKVMRELRRVCRGRIIISVPYEPIWRFLNLLRLKYIKDLGNTPGHLHHWNPNTIRDLVASYFKIITIQVSFPWIFILGVKPTSRGLQN